MANLLQEANGIHVAITGCGHGVLNSIYASIENACRLKGWNGVDLVIIGGDFQAIRNAYDLNAASIPTKFVEMQDFHEYYSGKRTAPYLTIFTGGNHEASNYMFELHHGGWVAPNIYYLGASGVVRLGPLRIAGLSGIWKGYDYNKPHHERLPYSQDDIKTPYHQRELDTRKLLQVRTQVDIGLSHDWPRGIEHYGNERQLFQFKPHLEPDSQNGTLGSIAAKQVMEHLRPPYWFASHLHCKFAAMRLWDEKGTANGTTQAHTDGDGQIPHVDARNEDEIQLDIEEDDGGQAVSNPIAERNEDEIDLDLKEDDVAEAAQSVSTSKPSAVSEELLAQLPDSFKQPAMSGRRGTLPPHPPAITNPSTHFLALDKLEPRKRFLQLQSIIPLDPSPINRPLKLSYDPEWLAITRVFTLEGSPLTSPVPPNNGYEYYHSNIDEAQTWVQENIVGKGISLEVPENFERIAPVYDESLGTRVKEQPREWPNPQTQAFCDLIGVKNHFAISEDEIQRRMKEALVLEQGSGPRYSGGFHGRGGFRGRGGNMRGSGFTGGRGRTRGGRFRGSWTERK